MRKKIDILADAIAGKLQTLPSTTARISTKKLLKAMDFEGYSPRSVRNAVEEVEAPDWSKCGRSFFRDKCKSSTISASVAVLPLPILTLTPAQIDAIIATTEPWKPKPAPEPVAGEQRSPFAPPLPSAHEVYLEWRRNRMAGKVKAETVVVGVDLSVAFQGQHDGDF